MSDEFEAYGSGRGWFKRFLGLLLVGIPLAFAGWSWLSLNYVYSKGERAGYTQKISRRGWVFKTWEGELAMANIPGTLPQIFQYTVRDEEVAHQLEKTIGNRVSISYEQHRGLPGNIFGETQYFVTKVTPVNDPYQVQTPAAEVPPAAK